jgi:hypothetical protein
MESRMHVRSALPLVPFHAGDQVRFSAFGEEKVRAMPEAWGLHRALSSGEIGTVIEVLLPPDADPPVASVEFDSGSAFYWELTCFEPI